MFAILALTISLFITASSTSCPQDAAGISYHSIEGDCQSYQLCLAGTSIKKACPDGLLFDETSNVCDVPENVNCPKQSSEGNAVQESGAFLHPDCPKQNPKEPVLLPHRVDCNKFYICDRGMAHEKTCQAGLHFNPKLKVCDYPEMAKCSTDSTSKQISLTCDQENRDELVLLPHETDCTKFIACWKGVPNHRKCPQGLHFNRKIKVCDFPERAGCDDSVSRQVVVTNSMISTDREAVGTRSPLCPLSNGKYPVFFRHQTNCSVYYVCGNGIAYEFTCPHSLHFNLEKQTCDAQYNAGCRDKDYDDYQY